MCSTMQSPRAAKAFSKACAARRWPAPEDADNSSTRGFDFTRAACFCGGTWRSLLSFAGGKFFKDAARDTLQLAKAGQVVLEFRIHELRCLAPKSDPQHHAAQPARMRKQRIFL